MLVIGNRHNVIYDQTFHVGAGRIGDSDPQFISCSDNFVLQADGDELEVIRQQFSGIPMTTNRVVRWHSDIAWFIFKNLKL